MSGVMSLQLMLVEVSGRQQTFIAHFAPWREVVKCGLFCIKKRIKFKVVHSQMWSVTKYFSLITCVCICFGSVTYSWPYNIFCLREIDTWLDQGSMRLFYASPLYMQTMINPHRFFQCSWVCECASARPCECMYYSCIRSIHVCRLKK